MYLSEIYKTTLACIGCNIKSLNGLEGVIKRRVNCRCAVGFGFVCARVSTLGQLRCFISLVHASAEVFVCPSTSRGSFFMDERDSSRLLLNYGYYYCVPLRLRLYRQNNIHDYTYTTTGYTQLTSNLWNFV